jgi:glycosyltransferase involved in cell wall biosynthesis
MRRNLRALVIAPQPFFSPRGTPFSVYYRTLVASELGVRIDLLTYGEGEDVDIPGVRVIRIPRFGFLGEVRVGPSYLKLFLDGFVFFWTLALLLRRRYDFVHAHEESVFFCRYLKPLFRFKLVYDMHSSLPEQLANFHFTRSRFWIGLLRRLEKTSIANADAVITICPYLADRVRALGVGEDRHLLIENSLFDEVRLKRTPRVGSEDSVKSSIPVGRRLIVYAGTFEPYQGGELLVLVGGAPGQRARIEEIVKARGLQGACRVHGRLSPGAARSLQASASVLVSPRLEGTNTPSKIYEILASGIPLVATRVPSHTQVLDARVCFLTEPNEASLAEGILAALTDDEQRRETVRAARELCEVKYSRAVYEQNMRKLLEVLT